MRRAHIVSPASAAAASLVSIRPDEELRLAKLRAMEAQVERDFQQARRDLNASNRRRSQRDYGTKAQRVKEGKR